MVCIPVLHYRTCSEVRWLLLAENDVKLRMRVKQLLGNDASWLLLRFNDRMVVSRQTTCGTVVSGVLVMVSSVRLDTQCDSSWTRSWYRVKLVAPEQSTVNFVSTSAPFVGEHVHCVGHRDLRAAATSSIVAQLTL